MGTDWNGLKRLWEDGCARIALTLVMLREQVRKSEDCVRP
jgi:hypothetical protein